MGNVFVRFGNLHAALPNDPAHTVAINQSCGKHAFCKECTTRMCRDRLFPQCPFCKEKTSQNSDANTIWLLPCSSWTRRPVCYACCGYTTCMCIVHHAALFPCIPVLGLYNLCGGFCKEGVDLFTDCKLL